MKRIDWESAKDILDTLNSLSWFSMDAGWMLEHKEVSFVMIPPTIISGILLCFMERNRPLTFINIAILSWICMNVSWMLSEVYADRTYHLLATGFLTAGIFFILIALYFSRNLSETFSHFRRFRLKNLFRD